MLSNICGIQFSWNKADFNMTEFSVLILFNWTFIKVIIINEDLILAYLFSCTFWCFCAAAHQIQ